MNVLLEWTCIVYAANRKSSYAHVGKSIKLATLNLYNYVSPPFAHYEFDNIYNQETWQLKNEKIKRYLLTNKPDIIGFQEVFSHNELAELVKEVGYEFFVVMDTPPISDGYIYTQSVVCLASRFPIKQKRILVPDPDLSVRLGSHTNFAYSRSPLHVTVELPVFGDTDFYVVHLKSKRVCINENTKSLSIAIQEGIEANTITMIQRTLEAAQLMYSFIYHRSFTNNPAIIMGDFNDDIDSECLSMLHIDTLSRIFKDMTEFPISHYQVHNSWDLYRLTKPSECEKSPFTFFHRKHGKTLDYILLTSDFHYLHNNQSTEISEFNCEDSHLFTHETPGIIFTDHAIIDVTITSKE